MSLPIDLTNAFYFYDPQEVNSFISFYDDLRKTYHSYKWDVSGAVTQLDLPYKIEAILSTGQIYCVDRNKAYIYDFNGNYKYQFNLGNLRFNYEYWDGINSEYRMVFTLPFWTRVDYEEYLNFNVYSIATRNLENLR